MIMHRLWVEPCLITLLLGDLIPRALHTLYHLPYGLLLGIALSCEGTV